MVKETTRDKLYKLSAVEIYKLVLKGDINRFPRGFWQNPEFEQNSIEIIKYLIEELLNWSDEDIRKKLNQQVFYENRLCGMLSNYFSDSPYKAINLAYLNRFKPWELKTVSMNYWNTDTGIEATKWLIEEKLRWSEAQIIKKLSQKLFYGYNLSGMLSNTFNNSPFQAINAAYPNTFKPWELRCMPMHYWNQKTAIEAIKWLIEEKLKWSENDIKEKLTSVVFNNFGLGGILIKIFKASPFNAINSAYPNKFKPWELKCAPMNYWTIQTAIEATKWLVEEKLKLSQSEFKEQLSVHVFRKNGLGGMLIIVYRDSLKLAIKTAYPDLLGF